MSGLMLRLPLFGLLMLLAACQPAAGLGLVAEVKPNVKRATALDSRIQIGYFATNANWRTAFSNPQQHVLLRVAYFFKIIVLDTDKPPPLLDPPIDIFMWDDYTVFDRWVSSLAVLPPALSWFTGGAMVQNFESKLQWKEWMKQIGLQEVIGKSYVLENASYPCMFKYANTHFGTGVKIAHSRADLVGFIEGANSKAGSQQKYDIEEALVGLGTSEIGVYGGAFEGRLTSLRCIKKYFDTKTLTKLANDTGKGNLFVAGQYLREARSNLIACGEEIVRDVSTMMRHSNFTGAFCVGVKFDGQQKAKFLEVNARLCRPLTHRYDLFAATYLPLAFAVRFRLNQQRVSRADKLAGRHWFDRLEFRQAYLHEQNLLKTGGMGRLGDEVSVERFSHEQEYVETIYNYKLAFLKKKTISKKSFSKNQTTNKILK
jgi:hypothetical protein